MSRQFRQQFEIYLFLPCPEPANLGITLGNLLRRRAAIYRRPLEAGRQLLFQAADTFHDEFVEIIVGDREKFDALEQRVPVILGFVQDPVIEAKPGQLTIEIEFGGLEVVLERGGRACRRPVHAAFGRRHIARGRDFLVGYFEPCFVGYAWQDGDLIIIFVTV